jgi:alpha-maltose-1-phosphate synthase
MNSFRSGKLVGEANVVVAHPGTQHSYEAAVALQDAGLLREYITGLYFKNNGFFYRLNRLLPDRARLRLDKQLMKRRRPGLRDEIVRTHWWVEAAFVASRNVAGSAWVVGRAFLMRNSVFSRLVARRITATVPAAVICYDSCALESFQAAERVGILKVLDQTCPHLTTSADVMEQESRTSLPEYRETLPPQWVLDKYTEEARHADLILAGSAFVKSSLTKIGIAADKVVVLPYGVDLELFSPPTEKNPSRKLTAVFAGQLGSRKGTAYLLQAFAGLSGLNCRLLLIGGSIKDKKALERYGVPFDHIPFAPRTELARRYQEADFFVFPSLLEGSALVTYEALAAGLPVITTPNSGSVVRDGIEGLIVPPRDVDALRQSIQTLAVNTELRRTMGLAARRRAEEYSWTRYHQRLAAIIRNELNNREAVSNPAKREARSLKTWAQ